jgi:hypothetical protein
MEVTIGGDPGGETRLEVVLRAAAVGGGDARDRGGGATAARAVEEELRRRASMRQRRSCGGTAVGSRWKVVVRCSCERGRRHATGENTAARRSSGLGHGGGTTKQRPVRVQ